MSYRDGLDDFHASLWQHRRATPVLSAQLPPRHVQMSQRRVQSLDEFNGAYPFFTTSKGFFGEAPNPMLAGREAQRRRLAQVSESQGFVPPVLIPTP